MSSPTDLVPSFTASHLGGFNIFSDLELFAAVSLLPSCQTNQTKDGPFPLLYMFCYYQGIIVQWNLYEGIVLLWQNKDWDCIIIEIRIWPLITKIPELRRRGIGIKIRRNIWVPNIAGLHWAGPELFRPTEHIRWGKVLHVFYYVSCIMYFIIFDIFNIQTRYTTY